MGNKGVTLHNLGVRVLGFAVSSLGPLKGGGSPSKQTEAESASVPDIIDYDF